jgi:succinoglycan biosynthesis transport protein ExoP
MTTISFSAAFMNIQEPTLIELLNSAKRRIYLIVAFMILGLLIGMMAVLVMPRKFEAQTLLSLDTTEQNFGSAGNNPPSGAMLQPPVESIVLSQIAVLQSRDLAENILKDLDLEQDPLFWQHSSKPSSAKRMHQKALLMITDNLDVKPVGRSLVMDVRFKHVNAAMSAKIANRIAELYQEQQVKEKIQTSNRNAVELQARLEILSKKLRESAKAVEEYSAQQDLVDGAKAEVTSEQISDISTQLVQAQADQAGVKARQSQIQEVLDDKKPADSVTEVIQSHMVSLLKDDEAALLSQMADLQSKYGPKHPKILALQAELAEVKHKQHSEIGRVTQNVDNEAVAVEAKIQLLQKKLQELEDKRKRENHAAIGLRELQREADANRVLYETFLGKYKETKMLGDLQQPDTKIISIARIPIKRSGTYPFLVIMISSFAGFMIGLALVLLLERLETTIRTPEQLQQLTGHDTLAVLPEIDNIPQSKVADYTIENPYSSLTESLRNLCIRVISRIEAKPCVITLTSCLPDDGKTKLALWMATLMAKSGLKILLVDADLRHPKLFNYADINPSFPVTDILLGRRGAEQCSFADPKIPNLSVMTGTAASSQDITSLSADILKNAFDRLKKTADIILVDAASFYIAESQLFNKVADYSIFVLPSDEITAKTVSSVFRQIQSDKNNIMGFVITGEGE